MMISHVRVLDGRAVDTLVDDRPGLPLPGHWASVPSALAIHHVDRALRLPVNVWLCVRVTGSRCGWLSWRDLPRRGPEREVPPFCFPPDAEKMAKLRQVRFAK